MEPKDFLKEIEEINDEIIAIRRHIHENPELSYQESETESFVAEKLEEYGIEFRRGVGGHGVVGLVKGGKGDRTIGLRADMDALPVTEETGLPFSSKVKGVMHACGHDSHVAMLLGAAKIIAKHRKDLKQNVKFLFQPAEEDGGDGGALPMIRDGALEDPHVDHVFGIHVMSNSPSGTVAIRSGPIMAAPDLFKIDIIGKGGHGSEPNEAIDPIFIGAQVINAIYGIRARFMNQVNPLVISVCMVSSGTKDNIIPEKMHMEGTIRTLDETMRAEVKKKMGEVVPKVIESFGAKGSISFKENAYPVTYNDPASTEKVKDILKMIPGLKIIDIGPIMGGEDVSRFMEKAPGTYYFLGTRNEQKNLTYPNHSSKFAADEDILKYGALSHVLIAFNFQ
jgi:carboxypeptidase Ss1